LGVQLSAELLRVCCLNPVCTADKQAFSPTQPEADQNQGGVEHIQDGELPDAASRGIESDKKKYIGNCLYELWPCNHRECVPCLNAPLANMKRLKLEMLSENAGAMLVELSALSAMRQVLAS
jgi:hypothetical protein